MNGHKWAITFVGKAEYILKSERQSPWLYGTLDTAIAEIKELDLTRCEIRFGHSTGKRNRRRKKDIMSDTAPMPGAISDDTESHLR